MTPEQKAAVLAALRGGNKIEAIRLCREATGLSLAEAKALVERPDFETDSSAVDELPEGAMGRIATELFTGNKIAAIKRFRTEVKPESGLAEAKAEVERLEAALRVRYPEERFSASSHRKGCGAMLLAMAGLMIVLVVILF